MRSNTQKGNQFSNNQNKKVNYCPQDLPLIDSTQLKIKQDKTKTTGVVTILILTEIKVKQNGSKDRKQKIELIISMILCQKSKNNFINILI